MATKFVPDAEDKDTKMQLAATETVITKTVVPVPQIDTSPAKKCPCEGNKQNYSTGFNGRRGWFIIEATAIFFMLACFFLMIHFFRKAIA